MTHEVLVVGGGPAGLGVALGYGPGVHVVESAAEAGGLCRSFDVGDATFDYGGHAFFTRDAEVDSIVEGAARGLFRQPRNAWVASHGSLVPYPFQSNLYGLPVDVVRECIVGAAERQGSPADAATLEEWIVRSFGSGIARHFMLPYNEKVWAHPPSALSSNWTGERVVLPSLEDIVDGALRRRTYDKFPNSVVRYPRRGGFGTIFTALARQVSIDYGVTIAEIDTARRTARTADGRDLEYERLVSTAPLPELARLLRPRSPDLEALTGALAYNSLCIVSLAVETRRRSRLHRVYSAAADTPFHKLVFNHNSSPSLRRRGVEMVQAEITYSPHKPRPEDPLRTTLAALRSLGLLDHSATVTASDVRDVRYAYPVQAHAARGYVERAVAMLAERGVSSVGRFGRWQYVNSDGALAAGVELGRNLR